MDPNSWTPFVPAVAVEEWDRRPDPDPEPPRPNGRRVSGWTNHDHEYLPIIDGGRKYQGYMPGEYLLPIDGAEQDRLDFNHQFYKILLDGNLSVVPFEKPPKWVLDIGTGTGIWAIEFAKENPESFVFGTDLSAIQPRPPPVNNCAWIQENSEKHEWTYWEPLDYIHLRAIGTCFDDLGEVLRKCYDNLQPGGWIELQDGALDLRCDDGTTVGTSIPEFCAVVNDGVRRLGRSMTRAKDFRTYLENSGFVHIQIIEFAVPGSPWPGDPKMKVVGYYMGRMMLAIVDSYAKFLEASGLAPHEIAELAERFEKDLNRVDCHWYLPCYAAIARKPFNPPLYYEGQYLT